jgi:hypothetical protein
MINLTTLRHPYPISMSNDVIPFLAGIGLLILYLLWSAATELGHPLALATIVLISGSQ